MNIRMEKVFELMDDNQIKRDLQAECFVKMVKCEWCDEETSLNFYRGRNHCNKCNRLIDKNGIKELF